mmetsp:Transcript_35094/g.87413  ORF Transcript_35094/g.87413 Transcript_35094/m.87413 type:complete len:253 (-) Transcript_35094:1388-2146(-)
MMIFPLKPFSRSCGRMDEPLMSGILLTGWSRLWSMISKSGGGSSDATYSGNPRISSAVLPLTSTCTLSRCNWIWSRRRTTWSSSSVTMRSEEGRLTSFAAKNRGSASTDSTYSLWNLICSSPSRVCAHFCAMRSPLFVLVESRSSPATPLSNWGRASTLWPKRATALRCISPGRLTTVKRSRPPSREARSVMRPSRSPYLTALVSRFSRMCITRLPSRLTIGGTSSSITIDARRALAVRSSSSTHTSVALAE